MPNTIETQETTATKGSLLSRLLLILGIVLIVGALAIAGYIAWGYLDAQNRYRELESVAGLEITEPEMVDNNLKLEDLTFDWAALRAINSDIVGWIIIPGTNINYPIVQGENNEVYLYKLFDNTYSGTGAVFADYEGSPTLTGQNNIIYGHNMFDGSMFSNILMYTNQAYFDEHRVVFLCTPARNFELSAIALIDVYADFALREFSFDSQYDFTEFVRFVVSEPVTYAADIESHVAGTEYLYSLVTCETFDGSKRTILCCVPVRSEVPTNA